MPTLPTLTVTDPQSVRILDAFKAMYGTATTAETVRAYKQWLAEQVKQIVLSYEARKIDDTNNNSKRNSLALIEAELPDPATVV